MTVESGEVMSNETYFAWHGLQPMARLFGSSKLDRHLVGGDGPRVVDDGGNWFLDARSSLWNVTLGYSHAGVIEAIKRQLDSLPYSVSIRYDRPPTIVGEFAAALAARLPPGLRRVRFGSNGSQMVEAAILLSRHIRRLQADPERRLVLSAGGSYHGTGGLVGAVTGEPAFNTDVPDTQGVFHFAAPYCYRCPWLLEFPSCHLHCAESLHQRIIELGPERITALILEPIRGTGGILLPPGYLEEVHRLCDLYGIHFIVDEVTTGFGRLGALTRCEQIQLTPDMLVLGKGMTSGYVPGAALVVSEMIFDEANLDPTLPPFTHGSTSDGHPLAMAAGVAVLNALFGDDLLGSVKERERTFQQCLHELKDQEKTVVDVRGAGLMLAIELANPDGIPWSPGWLDLLSKVSESKGLLISTVGNTVLLMPPLVVSDEDCLEICDLLAASIQEVTKQIGRRDSIVDGRRETP